MATEFEVTNKEVTQRIWDLIEDNDLDGLDEVLAEDVALRLPGQPEIRGIDGYKEYIRTYREAFPDTEIEVHDMFSDDDVVVTHFTWRATHEGEIEGIEATGNVVESPGMTLNRFENGKAVEDFNYWDNLDFFQQLGVMEPPTD
ncbi:ester cyclase [Natronosalvus vescus]|uniref:ester cyclase n=1 Tax=Natronosalvus vescus TaxID=2953881 RepID=UPI002091DAB2|nr:ester cyclase [Natronosalvus vescus]